MKTRFAPNGGLITIVAVLLFVFGYMPTVIQGQFGAALAYGDHVMGTITSSAPLGMYTFEANKADLVSAHVAATTGTLNPTVRIIAPDGRTIVASNDNDVFMPDGNRDAYISVLLTEPGTYYLLVGAAEETTGDYLLRLFGRPDVPLTVLVPGMPVDVEIPENPEPQYFAFNADPECAITLSITDLTDGTPLTFPFTAIIRDIQGTRIGMLQGGRLLTNDFTVMPNSSSYFVEIESADVFTSGVIRLEVGCAGSTLICREPGRLLPLQPVRPRRPYIPPPGRPGEPGNPYCGDGIISASRGEQCELPGTEICDIRCQSIEKEEPYCGDGIVSPDLGEECELPGTETCDIRCKKIGQTQPKCGDGVINQASEQCEPPGTATCDVQCKTIGQTQPKCGDGVINQASEQCEPPGTSECNAQCQKIGQQTQPVCGDGVVNQASEQCEPAGTATCDAQCRVIQQQQPYCGDGAVNQSSEQCDPPNTTDCTAQCQIYQPYCGDGAVNQSSEQCDPPNTTDCTAQCQIYQPYCGDGAVNQDWEQCDPPDGKSCDDKCQVIQQPKLYCGDGIVSPEIGEQCDPPDGVTCTTSDYQGGPCLIIPG